MNEAIRLAKEAAVQCREAARLLDLEPLPNDGGERKLLKVIRDGHTYDLRNTASNLERLASRLGVRRLSVASEAR